MDFEIRTATPAEQQYCYSQSTQIEGQAGSGICAQTLVQVEMTFLLPGLTATGSGKIPRFQMNLTS